MNLEIDKLTKTFLLPKKERKGENKRLKAVDNLSITLKSGEIYGLLGPNGAGKTTALRMIASLLKPDSGAIRLEGEDIYKDIYSYRKRIGFLTCDMKLDEFFTPDYTFDYLSRLHHIDEQTIKERKEYLFKQFGITAYRNKKIKELSTGMRQKAQLAISLAHDPDVIIFDEPTNGLDLVASKDVEDFLLDLKKQGKIIIISTHIFSIVEKLCDRVGILLKGYLKYEGMINGDERELEDTFFSIYKEER